MNNLPIQLLPACRRRDHVLAAYVNAALTAQTRVGLKRAEGFARAAGVPERVLLRVLVAGGPLRARARSREWSAGYGLAEDVAAESSVYFKVHDASAPSTVRVNRRVDWRMALLVDAAVNAAGSHGIAGAAAELIDLGLPVELVFRVLCRPGARRRHAPQPPPAQSRMPPAPALPCRRRNHVHAAYVNAALTISHLINVERAEGLLVEQGIARPVIVRILHLNGFRRRREGASPTVPAGARTQAGDSM